MYLPTEENTGEARILQDRSLLKESICKMDSLFLPAEIMVGFLGNILPADADLVPIAGTNEEWEKHERTSNGKMGEKNCWLEV